MLQRDAGGRAGGGGAGHLAAETWVTSKVQPVRRSIDYVLCYGAELSWDRSPHLKTAETKTTD